MFLTEDMHIQSDTQLPQSLRKTQTCAPDPVCLCELVERMVGAALPPEECQ